MKFFLYRKKRPSGSYYSFRVNTRINGKVKTRDVYLGKKDLAFKLIADFTSSPPTKERLYSYSGEVILSHIAQQLQLPQIINKHVLVETGFNCGQLLQYVIIERSLNPCSKWALAQKNHQQSYFSLLCQQDEMRFTDDNIYNYMDYISPYLQQIQSQLSRRLISQFQVPIEQIIIDATSIYFYLEDPEAEEDSKGSNEEKPQVVHGYSRDHRPDLKQVNLMLGVSQSYIPLIFETYSGNTSDVVMFKKTLDQMKQHFGHLLKSQPAIYLVCDNGNISAATYQTVAQLDRFCQQYPVHFVAGLKRQKVRQELQNLPPEWKDQQPLYSHNKTKLFGRQIKKKLYGKKRNILLYYNPKRATRETYFFRAKLQRTQKHIQHLIQQSQLTLVEKREQIRQYLKAQSMVRLFILRERSKSQLEILVNQEEKNHREALFGKRAVFSDDLSLSAEQLIQIYKTQGRVEQEFRLIKGLFSIRGVNHRKPERIKVHTALVLWGILLLAVLRQRLSTEQLNYSFEELVAILKQGMLSYGEYSYPELRKTYRITKILNINAKLQQIFEILGLSVDYFEIDVTPTIPTETATDQSD